MRNQSTKGSKAPPPKEPKQNAVAIWQPMSKPDKLPEEAVVKLPGTVTQVMGKDGKQKLDKQGNKVTRTQWGLSFTYRKLLSSWQSMG